MDLQFNFDPVTCDGVPILHCVRLLCSFLLSGEPGQTLPDKKARVSIKSLALNCTQYHWSPYVHSTSHHTTHTTIRSHNEGCFNPRTPLSHLEIYECSPPSSWILLQVVRPSVNGNSLLQLPRWWSWVLNPYPLLFVFVSLLFLPLLPLQVMEDTTISTTYQRPGTEVTVSTTFTRPSWVQRNREIL